MDTKYQTSNQILKDLNIILQHCKFDTTKIILVKIMQDLFGKEPILYMPIDKTSITYTTIDKASLLYTKIDENPTLYMPIELDGNNQPIVGKQQSNGKQVPNT